MNPPKPHYFARQPGGTFAPSGLARSPWDRNAIAGGPICSLFATAIADRLLDAEFEIARLSVDIFGKVPHAPLSLAGEVLRDGRQTKLHRIVMSASGKPAAQVHVLRVRRLATPVVPVPHGYPSPGAVPEVEHSGPSRMAGAIRLRPVLGRTGEPGRGVAWLSLQGEIVAGEAPSALARAMLFADFGNGFGNATRADEWSFANLDVTVQFLRMPVGEWLLLDAETHMAGNGHGTARNVFADEQGVYARGFQTIFVAPGHLSAELPTSAAR